MSTTAVIPESAPETQKIPTSQEWRKTGLRPEPSPAAPAPAKEPEKVSDAATTAEPAAASEAAIRQEPKRETAEDRKRQLNTEIRDLLRHRDSIKREIEVAEQSKPKAETSSATVKPKGLEPPVEPQESDFKTWEEFRKAEKKYTKDLAVYESQKAIRDYEAQREQSEQAKSLQQQLDEGRKRYPDLDKVIKPVAAMLEDPTKHGISPTVAGMINSSPVLADLLYVIGSNEADMNDFLHTARTDPAAAIRKAVLLEQLVIEELTKQNPKAPERQVAKPPAPASEVSGKTPPLIDEVQSAAQASADSGGDPRKFSAYMQAKNRADLARRKGK